MGYNYAFSLMHKPKCQHKGPRLLKSDFKQAGRQLRRRNNRIAKAQKVAPRPLESLKPIVQCPGMGHNTLAREGYGFTKQELEAVKLNTLRARQLGIAVDYRRRDRSQQALDRNVQRLQSYLDRLVIFKKDATKEQIAEACKQQVKTPLALEKVVPTVEIANTADFKSMNVYEEMHKARIAHLERRKAAKAEAAKGKK